MRYFDLHCDTISECYLQKQSLYSNNLHVSLERAMKFSSCTQCFAVWIPDQIRGKQALDFFRKVYEFFLHECAANQNTVMRCIRSSDFQQAERGIRLGAVLTVEGGAVLAGELANVQYLASCGVRMLTLTWNGICELGDGAMTQHPKGLTAFGKCVIPELESHDIVVDISHASQSLFYDVAEIAKKPIVASHSNAKAICNHPRNLTDEQFLIIKKSGGLVGLNFHPPFLKETGTATIDDIIRHAEHFLGLNGQNVLAIGSDFDGADLPEGMTGMGETGKIFNRFLQLGYSEDLLERIFYKNAYKFFVSL